MARLLRLPELGICLFAGLGKKPQNEVDPLLLAPAHQLLAGEARIAPQGDLYLRPARADLCHDSRHFLQRTRGAIAIGGAQLGTEQEITTKM
jgi:hypothetical protein